jgi:hypothetical protein
MQRMPPRCETQSIGTLDITWESNIQTASAHEAADVGLLSPELAAGIRRVKGVRRIGVRLGNWLIADLVGKGGHVRTVPVPMWVKGAVDAWVKTAGITNGRAF